jgi:hypothetical protein
MNTKTLISGLSLIVILTACLFAGNHAQAAIVGLKGNSLTQRQYLADVRSNNRSSDTRRFSFIKVGDSNSARHYFSYGLGCYGARGIPGSLKLVVNRYRNTRVGYGNTDFAADNCLSSSGQANPFNRISYAARGGMKTDYPKMIGTDVGIENCTSAVLVCELREVKPRYAFIQLGTNDARLTPNREMSQLELVQIRSNLKWTIDTVREYDAIPVLFTIPIAQNGQFMAENGPQRVMQINNSIRRVSNIDKTYLVDFWQVQFKRTGLANRWGLNKDNLHLSTKPGRNSFLSSTYLDFGSVSRYGMNLKNRVLVETLANLDKKAGLPLRAYRLKR